MDETMNEISVKCEEYLRSLEPDDLVNFESVRELSELTNELLVLREEGKELQNKQLREIAQTEELLKELKEVVYKTNSVSWHSFFTFIYRLIALAFFAVFVKFYIYSDQAEQLPESVINPEIEVLTQESSGDVDETKLENVWADY